VTVLVFFTHFLFRLGAEMIAFFLGLDDGFRTVKDVREQIAFPHNNRLSCFVAHAALSLA
jgi:hypothetical protein